MKLPDSLKLGHQHMRVAYGDGKSTDGTYRGMTRFEKSEIIIKRDMSSEMERQTLLHEMCEVWLDNAGYNVTPRIHQVIDIFASGLLAALNDNAALGAYLTQPKQQKGK